jgi:23S rRNA (cytidine2498-2'-O)-methyltransferase
MPHTPSFIFVTCQRGAEPALKAELAREWPPLRFAYSRPGFLTFKLSPELPEAFVQRFDVTELRSVFARSAGFSIGRADGTTREELVASVWKLAGESGVPFQQLHVWQRDTVRPGRFDFDPGPTPLAVEIDRALREQAPPETLAPHPRPLSPFGGEGSAAKPTPALPGQMVLDCVIVSSSEWWVGYHRADSLFSRWPGGLLAWEIPPGIVSRAYLKMEEALLWSGLPIQPGECVVELGSAPGGASQSLLNRGLRVIGVDPAEMHADVLAHPNFTHVRRKNKAAPHEVYREADWLTSDINMPPNYTLDAVEGALSVPGVRLRGVLLTLKLPEWSLAKRIPEFLDRVASWGFRDVRARQLQFNRQEICVAATDRKPRGGQR